jgi:mRNA interferase MazF
MSFDPQSGHEQAGWRPALVISPSLYNRVSSLAVLCPIASRVRGYPFEVRLPDDLDVAGVVLVDQVRSLDWRSRRARLVGRVPAGVMSEVLARLEPLVT